MKLTAHYFKNLDGLRTIAWLLVFLEHSVWRIFNRTDIGNFPFLNKVCTAVFSNGELGVSVFFTLSGFLITYLIFIEKEETGNFKIFAFYMRRILRIWPLYYAYIFFAFVIYPRLHEIAGIPFQMQSDPVKQLFFLSNFDSIDIRKLGPIDNLVTGITWSLSIEEQFYLFWPLLFLLFPRKRMPVVFVLILVFSVYFRFRHHSETSFLYFHTFSVFGDLVIGGASAYLVMYNQKARVTFMRLPDNLRRMLYISGILYLVFKDNYLGHPYSEVYSRTLAAIFVAFVILDQNFNSSSKFKLEKFKLLTLTGKYTYGLYLLHPIGLWISLLIFSYFDIASTWQTGILFSLAALVFSGLLAYFSYHYYESFFLKLKRRFSYTEVNAKPEYENGAR